MAKGLSRSHRILGAALLMSSLSFSLAQAQVFNLDENGNLQRAADTQSVLPTDISAPPPASEPSAEAENLTPQDEAPQAEAPLKNLGLTPVMLNVLTVDEIASLQRAQAEVRSRQIALEEREEARAQRLREALTPDETSELPTSETGEAFTVTELTPLAEPEIDASIFVLTATPSPDGIGIDAVTEPTAPAAKMPAMEKAEILAETGNTDFDDIIRTEVAKYDNIDFAFVKAVIEAESNYLTTAVSPKGAMGLMQIMPETAKTYAVVNPFNPAENIRAGTAELSRLMTVYRNPALALAGYNAGQGAVDKHDGVPPFRETQEYIVRVLTKTFEKRERAINPPFAEAATPDTVVDEVVEKDKKLKPMKIQSFDF